MTEGSFNERNESLISRLRWATADLQSFHFFDNDTKVGNHCACLFRLLAQNVDAVIDCPVSDLAARLHVVAHIILLI